MQGRTLKVEAVKESCTKISSSTTTNSCPISLLPEDIIVIVFIRTVFDALGCFRYRDAQNQARYLSQVSKNWRQIALCSSALWANIDTASISLQWVERMLLRSKTRPLGVQMEVFDDDVDAKKLHILLKHLSRFQKASIRIESAFADLLGSLCRALQSPTLLLESLHLTVETDGSERLKPPIPFPSITPKLRDLVLSGYNFTFHKPLSFQQLTHLQIQKAPYTVNDWRSILRFTPWLKQLSIKRAINSVSDMGFPIHGDNTLPWDPSSVTLSCLQRIQLEENSLGDSISLLVDLHLPALSCVSLTTSTVHHTLAPDILQEAVSQTLLSCWHKMESVCPLLRIEYFDVRVTIQTVCYDREAHSPDPVSCPCMKIEFPFLRYGAIEYQTAFIAGLQMTSLVDVSILEFHLLPVISVNEERVHHLLSAFRIVKQLIALAGMPFNILKRQISPGQQHNAPIIFPYLEAIHIVEGQHTPYDQESFILEFLDFLRWRLEVGAPIKKVTLSATIRRNLGDLIKKLAEISNLKVELAEVER